MSWMIKSMYGDYEVKSGVSIETIISACNLPDTITFIDENVYKSWPQFESLNPIVVQSSETTKTLDGVGLIIDEFIAAGGTPKTKIVAIGGGVVQDAVGFIASIWCRGVEYTLVPTTLLSQLDSCIGGKTSINHTRKNILGTFWPPKTILICFDLLKTLKDVDYWSGWGEWIKYNILQNKIDHIIDTISTMSRGGEERFIVDGLNYKIGIIQRDEFDRGERKFLNFGHTFGHALEAASNWEIPHGYAVFIGSLIAMYVSYGLRATPDPKALEDLKRMVSFGKGYLKKGQIGNNPAKWLTGELIEIAKRSDKKQEGGGGLRMVLTDGVNPYLHTVDDYSVLLQSIIWVSHEVFE